jgi:hypothetical protein
MAGRRTGTMAKRRCLRWESVERVVTFLVGTADRVARLIDEFRKLR